MNIYKEFAPTYISRGFSVIPDIYGTKRPSIKDWTLYCEQLPNQVELDEWGNKDANSNIAICLGKASGIIALDFDCTDPYLIDKIEKFMPESPVSKSGLKGWTRFFKYNGEVSESIKSNGEVVFEILSTGRKTTLPPSKHPSGMEYKWDSSDLLSIDKNELPSLPPFFLANLKHVLQCHTQVKVEGTKISNGRNDALKSQAALLISQSKPVDTAITELIKFDREAHEIPYFTDVNEHGHNEPFTNALTFYSQILQSINKKRARNSEEYEIPVTASAINHTHLEDVVKKKEHQPENQGSVSVNLPKPYGLLKEITDFILGNSFIKQPALAISASLSLVATLICRKLIFSGNAPNIYVLNVAPSGSGKDAPQQCIKSILIDLNLTHLLGAGDYVSDASLMDSLPQLPVRLDIVDEASGLLKAVNKGNNTFDGKMADILCELYTSSNSRFLGRQLANGETRGQVDRPGVSLLMSTTPRGFQESISITAVEKGLLGRTLIFEGDPLNPAERIKHFPSLPESLKNKVIALASIESVVSDTQIGGINQKVIEIESDRQATILLDSVFHEIDTLRRNESQDSLRLPIIARMFQQVCKIALIAAASRDPQGHIEVQAIDVEFAYDLVKINLSTFDRYLIDNIHDTTSDAYMAKVHTYLLRGEGKSLRDITKNLRSNLTTAQKRAILHQMTELGMVYVTLDKNGKSLYHGVKDEA